MSSIVPRLFGIYRASGYEPITGYSPFHFLMFEMFPLRRFSKTRISGAAPELLCRKSCSLSNSLISSHRSEFWSSVTLSVGARSRSRLCPECENGGHRSKCSWGKFYQRADHQEWSSRASCSGPLTRRCCCRGSGPIRRSGGFQSDRRDPHKRGGNCRLCRRQIGGDGSCSLSFSRCN